MRDGEDPWEVNDYRFEPPLWLDLLFSPWTAVPPLALVAIILVIGWLR
ncbi:hypothetical protein [Sphingosinicella sp. BN140058]|nr:hypothetical protein [Sphingosinicella sp. BN140058]